MLSARQRLRHCSVKFSDSGSLQHGLCLKSEKSSDSLTQSNSSSSVSLASASSDSTTASRNRRVAFKNTVKVVLIPHVTEYEYAGLKDDLWYGEDAISSFKLDAVQDYHAKYLQQQQHQQLSYSSLSSDFGIQRPLTCGA